VKQLAKEAGRLACFGGRADDEAMLVSLVVARAILLSTSVVIRADHLIE
jgi:hypothetical protein